MEQEFSDIFREVLAESSLSSFLGGDFELENLSCDEKIEKNEADTHGNEPTTQEDKALHQEGTGESELLLNMEAEDTYSAERVDDTQPQDVEDEEGLQGVSGLVSTDRRPEEDYGSSDPEGAVSQEDEDEDEDDEDNKIGTPEKPGKLLMSDSCDYEEHSGDGADEMFSEETPPVLEEDELPQCRDGEDEGDGDDYSWRYERFPECGDERMTKSREDEQKFEENLKPQLFYPECENMTLNPGVSSPAPGFEELESPYGDASTCSEFPSMSTQGLQDLISEVDVGKMKEFSGEEHEEAGESFADYPSDFSSFEYVGDGLKIQGIKPPASSWDSRDNTNNDTEGTLEDAIPSGPEEDADEQEDGYLYSRDLEMDAERMVSSIVAAGETDGKDIETGEDMLDEVTVRQLEDEGEAGETLSKHSSEDEVQVSGEGDHELSDKVDSNVLQDKDQVEDTWANNVSVTDCTEDADWDCVLSKTTSFLSDQSITEDTVEAEVSPSDLNPSAAGDTDGAKTSSYQGSVDDSLFFNRDLEITELGLMEEEDQEDERSWEQERINALFEFYNSNEVQTEGQERQIKVQFCAEPLSQVISYNSDSSEAGSLSSSSDEKDVSSAEVFQELRESDEIFKNIPSCSPIKTQLPRSFPENKDCHTKICSQKHMGLRMLKVTARMGVMMLIGLVMFWWTIGQPDWLPCLI